MNDLTSSVSDSEAMCLSIRWLQSIFARVKGSIKAKAEAKAKVESEISTT
jgi:hypothetical protein